MRQRSVVPGKITKEEVAVRRTVMLLASSCLAVGLLTGSALAGVRTITYKGKTAQHRKVALKVGRGQVVLRSFSIELKCRDGSTLIDTESGFEPSPLRAGRFKDVQVGSTDTVRFAGRVKGAKATGALKVTDMVDKVHCASPTVKFAASGR
jgi:hypothetical protein